MLRRRDFFFFVNKSKKKKTILFCFLEYIARVKERPTSGGGTARECAAWSVVDGRRRSSVRPGFPGFDSLESSAAVRSCRVCACARVSIRRARQFSTLVRCR